ncbi:hypothetical protein Tco_0587795 [Tanacetum coccineum]
MTEKEDVRSKFVRSALNVDDDEEELSWDVDDDKEDGNVVREYDKKPSSDCECKNDNKPSLDYERQNVSSDERKLSGGDVFGKKIESVLRTDKDHDNRLIMDEVKPSGGDEKVELVMKTNENVGVGSVSEKDKLQVDEDLEWDEIGDTGENDEKHVTQDGSLKKNEIGTLVNTKHESGSLTSASLSSVVAASKFSSKDNSLSLILAGSGPSLQDAAANSASCHLSVSQATKYSTKLEYCGFTTVFMLAGRCKVMRIGKLLFSRFGKFSGSPSSNSDLGDSDQADTPCLPCWIQRIGLSE